MQIQKVGMPVLSNLRYDFTIWVGDAQTSDLRQLEFEIVAASFYGEYPAGSAGNGTGRFMAGIVSFAIATWQPSGLIVDLTDLQYEFGNTILDAIDAGKQADGWRIPTRIVVGDPCRNGIYRLLRFARRQPEEWVSSTADEAVSSLLKVICED